MYLCDTESISGINSSRLFRLMPISLLLGASETDVVSSCRNVRGVGLLLKATTSAVRRLRVDRMALFEAL